MTFGQAFKSVFGGGVAFVAVCPLLALFPVVFELAQHVIEVRIGMYDSVAAAKAVEHAPVRMAFGLLKVAALVVPTYWVVRFIAFGDRNRALRLEAPAVRLFAGVFAFQIALAIVQLFGLPRTGTVQFAAFIGGMVVGITLSGWGVAAALGNGAVGPRASVALMWRQIPWTIAFSLATILPLMVPHYALAAIAIIGPRPLMWPVLVIDSLLVGALSVVMIATNYVAVARAAAKAGVSLVPADRYAAGRSFGGSRPDGLANAD